MFCKPGLKVERLGFTERHFIQAWQLLIVQPNNPSAKWSSPPNGRVILHAPAKQVHPEGYPIAHEPNEITNRRHPLALTFHLRYLLSSA